MLLNASQILAASDRKTCEVDVPEWGAGATVLVGSMGALGHARLQDWLDDHGSVPEEETPTTESCDSPEVEEKSAPKVYSKAEDMEVVLTWCIECILDPVSLKPAFTRDQMEALGEKNPAPLFRIYAKALELSLATPEAAETLEKNSERTAGAGSGGA